MRMRQKGTVTYICGNFFLVHIYQKSQPGSNRKEGNREAKRDGERERKNRNSVPVGQRMSSYSGDGGLPCWPSSKGAACQCRRPGVHPWSRRSAGRGNGNPLQCSRLGNPSDGGACPASVRAHELSRFSRVWLFETLWTVAHQAPPSMGFPRREYRSGLPFPTLGDLPNPEIECTSPA